MSNIKLSNVTLDYPIYDSASSIRSTILSKVGGLITKETDNKSNGSPFVVRALNNISFTLEKGDRLALIGHNGAGKSTLLKVLAGIYTPIKGDIVINGKVSALLDRLPGIINDDTGYENIVTCGLFLGMDLNEIEEKINDIAEFTELGNHLSLPVRTYSTGMKVRLGFALATSIDPEILLMDEGIGAGDARFAEKANNRLNALIERSNILVLASHSEALIRKICNKAALFNKGHLEKLCDIDEAYELYSRKK